MTKKLQVYKSEICGNIVEILHEGAGQLVCCGQPTKLSEEKAEERGKEKHLPVVEKDGGRLKIRVGSIPHPMEEKHYIEWVEAKTDKGVFRQFLSSGDKPEAEFQIEHEHIQVRTYCNLHGLWIKNNRG